MIRLIFSTTVLCAGFSHAVTIIDANFPDGTGTNPLFLEIDNAVGSNTWTQGTGVLGSSTANNSSIGAASDTTIDFATLGSDRLILTMSVASVTGTIQANGIFLGFQRRNNNGTGSDLWNNLGTAFGVVIPGASSVLGGVRNVGIGGNAGSGRYQTTTEGVATVESLQDGFDITITIDSSGWDVAIAGLETAAGLNDITGGSGVWGAGGVNAFADFDSDLRVGGSYQTTAAAGDLTFSSITLEQVSVPEPSSLAFVGFAALGTLRRRR